MCDCAGELGAFDPRLWMLASVEVRSRPEDQFVANTDCPKGPVVLGYWRWGIEPARSLESRPPLLETVGSLISLRFGDGLLKGLAEGVGREDLGTSEGSTPSPVAGPPGEKREGTVPARARRVWGTPRLSGEDRCAKSGKPSVGDSGMFSRRGVEPPLVGGPQTLGRRPSWAWISRALLGWMG
jgi:hypothetical protein